MLDPPNKKLHLWLLFVAFFMSTVSGAKVRTREEGFNFAADYDDVVGEIKHENFTCEGKKYGYYADQALECKVFHICSPVESGTGRHVKTFMFSFFCPDTTIFSQDSRTCITERYALPCHRAHTLYSLNSAIGVITPKGSRKHLPGVSFSSNSSINNVIPGGSGVTQKPQVFPQSSHRFSGLEPSKVISQSSKDRSLLNESLGKDSKDTTFDFKVRLGSNSSENFVERGIEKQNEEVNGKEVNKQTSVKNNASDLNVNLKNQNTITGRNKNVLEPITTPRPTPKIVNSNHQQSQISPRPKEGKPNPSFNVRTSLGENQNIADLPNPGISSLLSKNIPSHAKVSLSSNQNIGGNKKESSSFAVHNKPSTKNQLEARALGKISSQKNIQDQEIITTTFASVDNVTQEYQPEINNTDNEFDYPELLDLYDDLLQFEPDPKDLKPKVKNNQKGINSNKFGNNKDDNKKNQGPNKHTTNVGPPEKILPPPLVSIDAEFKQDIENDQVEDIDFDNDSDSIEEGEGPLENTDSSFVLSANVPTSRSVNSLQSSIDSLDNEDSIHRVRGNTNNRGRNNQISRTTEEATGGQKRSQASKTTTISPVTFARTVGLVTRNNVKTTTTPKTTTTTFAPVPRNYTTTTLRPITSERGSKRFVPSSLLRQNSNFGPHLSVTQNREKENHKTNGVSQIARPVTTTQTSPHIEELSSSQGPTRGTASPRPRVVTTTAPRSRVVTTAPQLLVTQSPSNIKIAQKPIIPLLIKKTDQLTQNHKEKEHQNASISKHIEKEFTKEVLDNQTSDNLLSTLPKAGEPIEKINHSIHTTEVKNLERSSSKDTSITEKIQEKSALFKEISKEKAKEIKERTKERINGQNGAIRKVTRTKVSPISRQVAEKNGPVIEANNLQGDKLSTNSTIIDDNEQHNKPIINLATISPNNVVSLSSEKQTRSKAIAIDSSSFRNNSARITKETDLNYDEQNLKTNQNYTIQNVVAINSDSFRKKDLRVLHQTSEDFQKTELVEKASANENANVPNNLPNAEVSVPVSRRRTTSRSRGTAKFQAVNNQDISSKQGIKTNVLTIRPPQTIVKKSKDKINLEISSNIAPIEIIKPKGLEILKGTENLHDQSKSGNMEQLTGTLNNTNPKQVKSEQVNNDSSKPDEKVNLTEPTNLNSQTPIRRRIVASPKSTQLPQLTSQLNSKNQQINAENTKIESYELDEKVNSNEPISLSNPTPIRTRIVASPNPIVSNTRSRGRSRSSSSTTKTVSKPNTPQPTNSNSSLITPKKALTDIRKGKNINAKSGPINLLPPITGKINSAQFAEIEKQIQRFASGNGAQLIAYSVKKNEKQPQKSAPPNSKIEKILEEPKLTLTPEVSKNQAANISEATDSSSGNEHQTKMNTEKTNDKTSVHDEKVNTNQSINLSSQTPVRRRIVASPKSTQLPQLTSQLNNKNQQINAENTKIESYELDEKVNSSKPINLSNPTPIRTRIVASPNPIVSNTRSRGRSRSSSSTTKTVSNPDTPQPINSNSSLITPKKAPTVIRKGKNINAKSGPINLLPPITGKINSAQLAEIEKQIQRFASGNGAQLIAYSVKKNEKQPPKSAPAISKIEKKLEESKLTLTPEVLKKQAANISEATDSPSGNDHKIRNITSNSGTKSTTVLQNASEPQVRRRLNSRVKVQALNIQSSENNTVKDVGKNVDPVESSISTTNKVNKPTNSLETKLNVTLVDDHNEVNKIQLKKQKSIGKTAVTEQSLLADNQINKNTENIIDVQKNDHPEVVKSISDNSETSLNQPRRNTRVRKISQISTTQGTTPVTSTTLSVTEAKPSSSTTTPKTISRQRTRGRSVGRRIEDPVATSKVRVIEEKKLENQLVSPNDIVLSNQPDKQENTTTTTVETVTFENRASNIQRTRNRASSAQRNKANIAQTTVTTNARINQASVSTIPISEEVKKGNEVGARSPVNLIQSIRNLNTNRQRNRGGPNVDLYDNNHINETKFEEQKVTNLFEEKINLITSTPASKVSLTEIIKPKSLLSSLRTQNKLQGRSRNRDLGTTNNIKVLESTQQNNSAVLSANDPINIIINSHSKNLTEEAKKVENVDETTTSKSIDTKINSRSRIRNSKSETIVNKKSQIVNEDLIDSKEQANLKSKPSRRVVNAEQSSTSTIVPTQPPNQKVKDLELSEQNTVQSAVRRITRKRITTAEQTDTKPQVVKSISSLVTKDDKESFKAVPNKVIENHNGEKTTGNSSVRRVSRKRVSSQDKSINPVTEIPTTNVNNTQKDDIISKVFESFAATTTEKVQTSFQKKTVSRGSRKFEEDTPKEDLHFALDLLSEVGTDSKSGKDAKQYSVSLTERDPTSKKKVLKKVIPAREFRQKGSEGAEENAEVFSGLKLRVVGTSVKSSVSSVSNGKEGKKNLDLVTSSTSTNSQSLTDLELEALRSLTQVNEPVRNRNQESSQNSRRKLISRRKV